MAWQETSEVRQVCTLNEDTQLRWLFLIKEKKKGEVSSTFSSKQTPAKGVISTAITVHSLKMETVFAKYCLTVFLISMAYLKKKKASQPNTSFCWPFCLKDWNPIRSPHKQAQTANIKKLYTKICNYLSYILEYCFCHQREDV